MTCEEAQSPLPVLRFDNPNTIDEESNHFTQGLKRCNSDSQEEVLDLPEGEELKDDGNHSLIKLDSKQCIEDSIDNEMSSASPMRRISREDSGFLQYSKSKFNVKNQKPNINKRRDIKGETKKSNQSDYTPLFNIIDNKRQNSDNIIKPIFVITRHSQL